MSLATRTNSLLFAIEAVAVGAVIGNVSQISADRRLGQRIHLLPEWSAILGNPAIHQFDGQFGEINPRPLALQAVSGALAHL